MVPIVSRYQEAGTNQLSVEVVEKLELQETQGNNLFEHLIELIREKAEERIKRGIKKMMPTKVELPRIEETNYTS